MSAVVLETVSKSFGTHNAVSELSLTVPDASVFGFLGPNGAGKTTTLRMIMGMLWPDAGRITLLGGLDPEQARPLLSYLPEEKGLYRRMGVLELLVYFARLRGLTVAEANRRAHAWLERFELAHVAGARCEALSKGMGQKLQIAAALIHDPRLVILDEPFSGLDPVNVELVRNIVLELARNGTTVILSTHVMEQAEQICDHVVLLDQGRVLLGGAMAEVRASSDRTLIIEYEGDGRCLTGLAGVTRVNDAGVHAELSLDADADPDALLHTLLEHIRIRRFEIAEPSLHEVFVRNVGRLQPAADAANATRS